MKLSAQLALETSVNRTLDLRITRSLNTSTIHDDHLDHFPEGADYFTSDPSAIDKYLMSNTMSRIKGGIITGMNLNEETGIWTVTGRNADKMTVKAEHSVLAIAKTLAGLEMIGL